MPSFTDFVPTKVGDILYEYAQKNLRFKREAEQTLWNLKGVVKGDLAVGGSTIPGGYIFPSLIKGFRNNFSDIIIKPTIGDKKKLLKLLLSITGLSLVSLVLSWRM